jgi:hypothetical protein
VNFAKKAITLCVVFLAWGLISPFLTVHTFPEDSPSKNHPQAESQLVAPAFPLISQASQSEYVGSEVHQPTKDHGRQNWAGVWAYDLTVKRLLNTFLNSSIVGSISQRKTDLLFPFHSFW